ncbi:unnamed protein product [Rotaria sp. Silwood1]|nr:unnamed protein product [Rotaria sp. Silwood1]CAF0834775.1 unnamed protein product [Rotaria sp. Silwood1]CAF3339294.1 unnamed protein product [Rotaria sp. Silwood1]CAF3403175.1 unnamed protein product [Rotaria sp. Silwood1]CAF4744513.1 unnamed protein product [Rotaria sp. Silwood1]
MNNENQTLTDIKISVLVLGRPLVIINSIGIIIGTIFSILCIIKYFKNSDLRTHYTYVFYFMLIYCLLSSVIRSPTFLIGHYLNLFQYSLSLCAISTIHYLTVNIGMVTSLAYASIERHFLIFHKNGLLTWQRQLLPVTCILVYSYLIAILFTLMPTCTLIRCIGCYTTRFLYMIPWLMISFFIPQLVMIISTIYLLFRLYQQRTMFNRRPEWSALQKIVKQMSIYVIWSCLCYCPVSFYNLSIIINPSRFSPDLKTAMDIINTTILQSYPILTFISMLLFTRRRQAQQKRQPSVKLNNLTTIITPPSDQNSLTLKKIEK